MAGGSNPQRVATPAPATAPAPVAAVRPTPTPAAPAANNVFTQSAGALTSGINAANAAASYKPQQVGTSFGYTPQNVTAGQAYTGMANYQNPFTQQVIDTSMADLERQRQMQMAQIGAQASAAGAFGGSRHGVAEALTNEGFFNQGGQLASGLRMQGFNTALGASQQDVANQLQAALANQGAGARAQEFGQSSRLQAQIANQQAANQAAAQRAAAASTLGNLSQTGFNMGQSIAQQQMQQGLLQQNINQALIDAGRNQYAGFTGSPGQSLNTTLAALGGANMGQQTQTTTYQPGLFNYLALGLGALSDIRLKDDIKPAGEVGGVRFYTWNWNETGKRLADPNQPTFGVIADEVAISHPQYVSRGADGYLRVNYAGLIGELRAA